jgi:hypothetical protein
MAIKLVVATCLSLIASRDAARASGDSHSTEDLVSAAGQVNNESSKLDSAADLVSAAGLSEHKLHLVHSACPHPFYFPTSCWESIVPEMGISATEVYIKEHSLHSVLSETVTDVILQRPAAPLQLLSQKLLSRAYHGQMYFVRDDHSTTEQQVNLASELHRFAGGSLWLEFVYEDELARVREAFATPDVTDDATVLRAVQEALSRNKWSSEYNAALTALLRVANRYGMSIHALDSPEWSLDAFISKYGRFSGKIKYLSNRASRRDDGTGATSRWVSKVLAELDRGSSTTPLVVLGGSEHGPAMRDILRARRDLDMQYLFESSEAVEAAAKKKLERAFEAAELEKTADEPDAPGDMYFVRDDHTTTEQQVNLQNELHRFAGGSLWLEFFYEEELAKVREAFASPDAADDAIVLRAVQEALSRNNWSSEYNAALTALLKVANRYKMSIHALDTPEWSREAFRANYSNHSQLMGFMEYVKNRGSPEDDGEGATSRWVSTVLAELDRGTSTTPLVVLGGAKHGPIMRDILQARRGLHMQYLFESSGAVQAAAKRELEGMLEVAEAKKAAEEAEASRKVAELKTSILARWQ